MDEETFREILSLLYRHYDPSQRFYFHYDAFATIPEEEEAVFFGKLEEVGRIPALFPELIKNTPTNWCDVNESVYLCTDFDATFTLIAGSKALIKEVIQSPVLEAIPIKETKLRR